MIHKPQRARNVLRSLWRISFFEDAMIYSAHRITCRWLTLLLIACLLTTSSLAQATRSPISGKRYNRIVIRNAMVVDGNGTPASGPKDIVIEDNRIAEIVSFDPISAMQGT